MGIIYFDICSIPLFLMILFVCYSRKMNKGSANQLFIALVLFSLFSAVADLGIEIPDRMLPLSEPVKIFCSLSSYVYLALRNGTNAILLLFLLALTRTTFLLKKIWVKVAFTLPYICILILLAQNPFTHTVFTVTAEAGYARGPLIILFYGIAAFYGLVGLIYCIYCRRYLSSEKWSILLSIYLMVHFVVIVQFFYPELLLEMFCTALSEMLVLLCILRPEERMDSDVGMLSWVSYQSDIRNILLSGEHVQIIVIRMPNSQEIRNYLGDQSYDDYMSKIADGVRNINWKHQSRIEVYYEQPGTIYLITDADEPGTQNIRDILMSEIGRYIEHYREMGVRFEPQVCLIQCPEDIQTAQDIISLGHIFHKTDNGKQTTFFAREIVRSKSFAIEAHIVDILNRAIKDDLVQMYYQPIYDIKSGTFQSAEALARILDPEYGMISPAIFIPAAEKEGYMIAIGDAVLDHSFRFISEQDLDAIGLSYIEINLSVAQCMESSLADKISALQKKYGVDPSRVNLEITETTFENINDVMVENVNKLIQMGYSFALDDYGTGYSNIQRVNHIPLKLIKIDKSMLDEVSTVSGRRILEHTIRMMQSIDKKLVVEGAEAGDQVDILENMDCDYIQGFFFSRPLPEDEFVRYIEEHNNCMY